MLLLVQLTELIMTNVSKKHVPKKEFDALFDQFSTTVSKLKPRNTSHFFNEFFTESEKIMFTKRLGAILMIHKGYSPYRVWTTLRLSSATTKKLCLQYAEGCYVELIKAIDAQKQMEELWNTLEILLRAGMPEQGKN